MFDSNWSADQIVQSVIVVAAVTAIAAYLVRVFRCSGKKPWPAFFVGIYDILLLLFYLFAVLTQVSWEGFGSFPLLVLTTPWSWLAIWLLNSTGVLDSKILGSGNAETILFNLMVFALSGAGNSCILYFFLKRGQKKAAEDEAWEQARRNR
jgi:hypothetical protein